jgi:hypothetical protein
MVSRFVTRRQNNGEYYVWDNKTGAVAQIADGQSRYENLEFNRAIDVAMELNGPGRAAKRTPELPQQAAQQQQQPQPDDSDKKK